MENDVASTTLAKETVPGFGPSAQWGLASLLIGSVVLLASAVMLVFNAFIAARPYRMPMGFVWTASMVGAITILAIAITSIVFGIRAWLMAGRQRQCPALAVAGTFMSIAAVVGWLIVSIDLIAILAS